MHEPIWLTRAMLDVTHSELIAEHGGADGPRAGGDDLIESALARPRQKLAYAPDSDVPALAAAYFYGLVKNHGFVDDNKRVAFEAAATFLLLNGLRLAAPESDAYDTAIAAAEGRIDEEDMAGWIRADVRPT